jgi:flagellar basal-body rod protein FlgB
MTMSIQFRQAIELHAAALQLRTARTQVLAANIANENTPGYQARDVDFAAQLQAHQAQEVQMADGPGNAADDQNSPLYRVPYHPSRDGNTVEIGIEQAAFSQNAADFQASLTFVNLTLRGIAKAIAGQ